MKKTFTTIYAIFCTLLLITGFLLAFVFAWREGVGEAIKCLCGLALGFILSPILHELGHVSFALIAKMECIYVKCFCFKIYVKNGKKRLGFASPFSADETQAVPLCGGNMKKRAILYTIGGLVFSGIFLILISGAAIALLSVREINYVLWGILPYAVYLFMLNIVPAEYASGKTDILVYIGLKKGFDAEKNMLSAMEIQGQLCEGKSFAEIDESLYFDVPQLCEDEPLFALMLDLRYRLCLERGDMQKAMECLNRLASISDYLSEYEMERIAAEFVYIHSLRGDLSEAERNYKACQNFLKQELPTSRRVLAAWAKASGKTEFLATLLESANAYMSNERVIGVRKFEKILLSRIEK